MSINRNITKIITKDEFKYMLSTRNISGYKFINDNKILTIFSPYPSREVCESHGLDYHKVLNKDIKKQYAEKLN